MTLYFYSVAFEDYREIFVSSNLNELRKNRDENARRLEGTGAFIGMIAGHDAPILKLAVAEDDF